MSDYETYLTDQFVGRDFWISAKAELERYSGKRENNGAYFCAQDTLISRFDEPDPDRVADDLGYVNRAVENVDVPVYFSLIPGKVSVWADRLPEGAPNASEEAILSQAQETTQAEWIDVDGALRAHAGEEIYYRLDHHWTSLGAYYGYAALASAMGMEPTPLSDYEKTTVSTDFNGTTYSSSGVRWMEPDSIDIYVPEDGIQVTAWNSAQPEEGVPLRLVQAGGEGQVRLLPGGEQAPGRHPDPERRPPAADRPGLLRRQHGPLLHRQLLGDPPLRPPVQQDPSEPVCPGEPDRPGAGPLQRGQFRHRQLPLRAGTVIAGSG